MNKFVKQSKQNKSNANKIVAILIFIIIICIAINPSKYSQIALYSLDVWVKVLVPTLFPFFVLTKLFSATGVINDFTNIFKKPFKALYNCPQISSYIFLMSIITGYPVGAKLVSDCYNSGTLTKNEAVRTLSFSANSGPMFILGSVAIGMFSNKTMGLIIYLSHILGSVLNGFLYRNYGKKQKQGINNNLSCFTYEKSYINEDKNQNNINFSESISSSITSIMLIGGVICFAFVLIEVITSSFIFKHIITAISKIGLNPQTITAVFSGFFEITKGCMLISNTPLVITIATILCTAIISFGGISTLLQAMAFTKNIVPTKTFILQKLTHAILSTIVCCPLVLLATI